MMRAFLALAIFAGVFSLKAQESTSGVDVRATLSAEAIHSTLLTDPAAGSFRGVVYPSWKIDNHWLVSGAVQLVSRPYFPEDFDQPGYGVRMRVLQANLGYSLVSKKASLVIRAGQLSSAFGSFLLHYDDADNPLVDAPLQYGYYGSGVTVLGLAGIQADLTAGKWDARAQFTDASPATARSIFDHDRYGNWAGGVGFTIRQGLRVGVSAYRGPYLYIGQPFVQPGPQGFHNLPATGRGLDVQWATGHWNIQGELDHFDMTYNVIPVFRENAAYVEARRVLHPRLYVAGRAGYLHTNAGFGGETYEVVAGFRPSTWQLVKVGYEISHDAFGTLSHTLILQVVTTVHPLSLSFNRSKG
jgi:hypothetical protein